MPFVIPPRGVILEDSMTARDDESIVTHKILIIAPQSSRADIFEVGHVESSVGTCAETSDYVGPGNSKLRG